MVQENKISDGIKSWAERPKFELYRTSKSNPYGPIGLVAEITPDIVDENGREKLSAGKLLAKLNDLVAKEAESSSMTLKPMTYEDVSVVKNGKVYRLNENWSATINSCLVLVTNTAMLVQDRTGLEKTRQWVLIGNWKGNAHPKPGTGTRYKVRIIVSDVNEGDCLDISRWDNTLAPTFDHVGPLTVKGLLTEKLRLFDDDDLDKVTDIRDSILIGDVPMFEINAGMNRIISNKRPSGLTFVFNDKTRFNLRIFPTEPPNPCETKKPEIEVASESVSGKWVKEWLNSLYGKEKLCEFVFGRKDLAEKNHATPGLEEFLKEKDHEPDIPEKGNQTFDPVEKPEHYANGSLECFDWIEAMMTPEEFKGYLKGCALKYLWRYDDKENPVQDLKKASKYILKLAEKREEELEEERWSDILGNRKNTRIPCDHPMTTYKEGDPRLRSHN